MADQTPRNPGNSASSKQSTRSADQYKGTPKSKRLKFVNNTNDGRRRSRQADNTPMNSIVPSSESIISDAIASPSKKSDDDKPKSDDSSTIGISPEEQAAFSQILNEQRTSRYNKEITLAQREKKVYQREMEVALREYAVGNAQKAIATDREVIAKQFKDVAQEMMKVLDEKAKIDEANIKLKRSFETELQNAKNLFHRELAQIENKLAKMQQYIDGRPSKGDKFCSVCDKSLQRCTEKLKIMRNPIGRIEKMETELHKSQPAPVVSGPTLEDAMDELSKVLGLEYQYLPSLESSSNDVQSAQALMPARASDKETTASVVNPASFYRIDNLSDMLHFGPSVDDTTSAENTESNAQTFPDIYRDVGEPEPRSGRRTPDII